MSPIHVTRDGQKIPISQLTNSHLLNILRYQHRVTDEALSWGPPPDCLTSLDPEGDILTAMGHHLYVCEATRRSLRLPCECECEEE